MMWWGSGFGWIWMVIMWVVVIGAIAGVVWLVTQASASARPAARDTADGARRILDERFARGEIDEDDYRRRRDELSA